MFKELGLQWYPFAQTIFKTVSYIAQHIKNQAFIYFNEQTGTVLANLRRYEKFNQGFSSGTSTV